MLRFPSFLPEAHEQQDYLIRLVSEVQDLQRRVQQLEEDKLNNSTENKTVHPTNLGL